MPILILTAALMVGVVALALYITRPHDRSDS